MTGSQLPRTPDDGDSDAAVEALRFLAGPTNAEILRRQEFDKARFHLPADYACIGCWWCHPKEPGSRIARAALKALGEDY